MAASSDLHIARGEESTQPGPFSLAYLSWARQRHPAIGSAVPSAPDDRDRQLSRRTGTTSCNWEDSPKPACVTQS